MDYYWNVETGAASSVVYAMPGARIASGGRPVRPLSEHPAMVEDGRLASLPLPTQGPPRLWAKSHFSIQTIRIYECLKRCGSLCIPDVASITGLKKSSVLYSVVSFPEIFCKVGATRGLHGERGVYALTPGAHTDPRIVAGMDGETKRLAGQLVADIAALLKERGSMTCSNISRAMDTPYSNVRMALLRNILVFTFEGNGKQRRYSLIG